MWHFSSRITKAEIERGYINNPSARPAVFLFLPEEDRYTLSKSVKGQNVIPTLVLSSGPFPGRRSRGTSVHL